MVGNLKLLDELSRELHAATFGQFEAVMPQPDHERPDAIR